MNRRIEALGAPVHSLCACHPDVAVENVVGFECASEFLLEQEEFGSGIEQEAVAVEPVRVVAFVPFKLWIDLNLKNPGFEAKLGIHRVFVHIKSGNAPLVVLVVAHCEVSCFRHFLGAKFFIAENQRLSP